MQATTTKLSRDAQAILLLCATLGKTGTRPLTAAEYHQLAKWLHDRQARPGDLFDLERQDALLDGAPLEKERFTALFERGALLALRYDDWSARNIWVLTRSDAAYPRRYKQRLQHGAPPVLYGAGNRDLLALGGVAIVGSRNIDDAGTRFADGVARHSAGIGQTVISGGARGVDETAMLEALEAGGSVVGILSSELERQVVAKKFRNHLIGGRLVLVSPTDPSAGFTVGYAMARNKLIYALSDVAVVVSSDQDKGGTWAGATENIKADWVPLLVRATPDVPAGNQALIAKGGIACTLEAVVSASIIDWYRKDTPDPSSQATRPVDATVPSPPPVAVVEVPPVTPAEPVSHDLFAVVWPHIAAQLITPRAEKDLATTLCVQATQMRLWLTTAVEQNLAQKVVVKKKTVFALVPPADSANPALAGQMNLFGR